VELELAIVIFVLLTAGFYMLLRRSLTKLLIGLVLLSHAANLLIFLSAGLTRGRPPLLEAGSYTPPEVYADPMPQALVLTAIVISFGVIAFAMVLFQRAYQVLGTDDVDMMRATDTAGEDESL